MTDLRAGQVGAEAVGAPAAPGVASAHVCAEVIWWAGSVPPGAAAQTLAESAEKNPAPPLGGLQMLAEVLWREAIPPVSVAGTSIGCSLAWSDDRGASYGNPVVKSVGLSGEYAVSMKWTRLGMARDRVFVLTWSEAHQVVLQGAWITYEPGAT